MKDADPQRQLAAALGRIPSGLFILTLRRAADETGMLCSWVQQCSLVPLQVSVAIKRDRAVAAWLTEGTSFVLNILDESQTEMVIHFGKGFAPGEPAFVDLALEPGDTCAPVLSEALAYLQCRLTGRYAAGDHDLIVGEVIAGRMLNEGQPMVHIRKSGTHY